MLHLVEKKSAGKVLGLSESLGSFLRFGHETGATPGAAKRLYRLSTAVSVPVNMVTEAFASIRPVIKENGEFITDHPVLDLINQPSPDYTEDLFLETIAKDYLITGESHIVGIGNINRPPFELQPIGPENLSPSEGSNGFAQTWQISGNTLPGVYQRTKQGRRIRYIRDNLTEIGLIRSYSTRNNALLRGESVLRSASAEARQHIKGNAHNISILETGGRLTLHFHTKGDMGPDDFESWKTSIRSQYGGTSGERIAITSGDELSIEEFGVNNKDMDFALLQEMARTACALAYKVPLPLVTAKAATLNNYQEGRVALYIDAVLPLADRLYAGMTKLLMPRFGLDPAKTQITFNRQIIPALSQLVLDEVKTRREINVESDNELRKFMDKEPYDGGDQILKPVNLVPVGTDLFTDDQIIKPTLARDE